MLRIALDGHDIDGFRLMRMDVDRKTEVGRQVSTHLAPGFAGVVTPHHIPMLLHKQRLRAAAVHGDPMHAVADLSIRIGKELRVKPAIDRLPRLSAVIAAESARGRDGDEYAIPVAGVKKNRMETHASSTRLPTRARAVAAQAGELLPVLPAVRGTEQSRVFNSRVDRVRIGERWFQMPDPLELPGVCRAVIPLMSTGDAVV